MSKFSINLYLAAILIVGLVYSLILSGLISNFQALPSPIFGGDYYFQLGTVYHMYESSFLDWFKSANMLGELPAYLPFYGILVTIFGKLLSLDPIQAMLKFNLILPLFALLFTFLFLKSLFSSDKIALLGSLFLIPFTNFPILKYTDFTSVLLVPLFFYFLWSFYKEQNKKTALFLGIMFAIMSFSHTTSFAYAAVLIGFLFLLILFEKYTKDKQKFNIKTEIFNLSHFFLYSFGLGFLVAQILWFEPIFIYHGHSTLGNVLWTTPDVHVPSIALDLFFLQMQYMFFNFSSIYSIVISVSTVLGFYFLFKNPFKDKTTIFLLFLFITSFLLIYSYFITSPLFDFHLVPGYMFSMYLSKISILIGLFFIKDKLFALKYGDIVLGILILLVLFNGYSSYDNWISNQWFENGKHPISPIYSSLQIYLLENSDVNDVILTNNELGFAINSISGRKLVVSRRSQNDPFMDFDQRELDASIIFYSPYNIQQKLQLLKKYNVKYLYYDVNWVGLEYRFDGNGQIISYSDPMMLIYSPEKEQLLKDNGISYLKHYGWIDPAMRGDNIRQYELLLITPGNYDDVGYGPWRSELDQYLTPVWSYEENGKPVAVLYKANY